MELTILKIYGCKNLTQETLNIIQSYIMTTRGP